MSNRHWASVASGIALVLGSVAATAENRGTWHYDEQFDTIVLDVPGSRDKYRTGARNHGPQPSAAERNANWYYDAGLDTIVLNVLGSRAAHTAN
jgi:hypothetical protein